MKRTAPPANVPKEAVRYLEKAAEHLGEIAKDNSLKLKKYDQYHPDHTAWFHALYGKSRDRQFCIQVVTDAEMAPHLSSNVIGYIHLLTPNGAGEWLLYEKRKVSDMVGLVTGVADTMEAIRCACVFRMPHPTDPDPKA